MPVSSEEEFRGTLQLLGESLSAAGREVALRKFEPSLDKFLNDEDAVKGEESVEESTIEVKRAGVPSALSLPVGAGRDVFAVDASSILLGETSKGQIFAVRGTAVQWNPGTQSAKVILRFESPCYVSEGNKGQLYNELRQRLLGLSADKTAPEVHKMVDRVRNLYERYIQLWLSENQKDAILLFDGSLTGDTIDTPAEVLERILHNAADEGSDVVAFSKKTRLVTKEGEKILDLLAGVEHVPTIVPIMNLLEQSSRFRLLGKVYVAKLSKIPLSFRVDVYSAREHAQVFADLLASTFMESGYPKPLIYAHLYSYFNAFDALSHQAVLAKQGLNLREEFDVRRLLFGYYGG